jgi:hypothetical protein
MTDPTANPKAQAIITEQWKAVVAKDAIKAMADDFVGPPCHCGHDLYDHAALEDEQPYQECSCQAFRQPNTCRCGKVLPESCGFHPEGEQCMCFGTICDKCLNEMLGHVNSDHD